MRAGDEDCGTIQGCGRRIQHDVSGKALAVLGLMEMCDAANHVGLLEQ